jgi:hypothetical protein
VPDEPRYQVRITAPAGTLLHGPGPFALISRRNLIREVTEIVLEAEGSAYDDINAGRVWCLITEVPDGYWGGLGEMFRMHDISAYASDEVAPTELSVRARAAFSHYSEASTAIGA